MNLTSGKVDYVREVKDRQSAILFEEFLGASEVVKKDPRWRAAMAKRGDHHFRPYHLRATDRRAGDRRRYRGLRPLQGARASTKPER